ncbi:MAG TPA: MerR family transcriptional regulator [Candidatus Dormibacteraeota bacterium]|nr:MerR family transcriptional regulator [Candidatus Dormibacteraeota bacterium]
MYNIKEAAARAGVSVPVLRAWERRYGIVQPARTSSGYRQFDDATVARVRAMRALVEDGWSPSAAAASILAGTSLVPSGSPADGGSLPGPKGTASMDGAVAVADRFVAAARAMEPNAIAETLDDVFARGSFERVVSDLLFPALERLGDAWARGEVSVAGEHLASSAVQRRLAQALEAAGPANAAPGGILVGLPPGSRHELGALAFAVAARRTGLPIVYLGSDLPFDEWVSATRDARGAVIGVVTARDRTAALELARRLRAAHRDLVIALGGRSAPASSEALQLPSRLTESVAALRAALAAAPA